jgi:beta-galactosidase
MAGGIRDGKAIADPCSAQQANQRASALSAERTTVGADGQSLPFTTVEGVDGGGQRYPNADHQMAFASKAPRNIAAAGNGDLTGEERYCGRQQELLHAKVPLIVRRWPGRAFSRLLQRPGRLPPFKSHCGVRTP